MKVFYAMPFTGNTFTKLVNERRKLRQEAKEFELDLIEQFIGTETKKKYESHAYGPLFIVEKDHRLLREADIIIADYHSHSIGRDCEIVMAKEMYDKRVISIVPDPHMRNHPWVRLYSDYVVESRKEAFLLAQQLSHLSLSSKVSNLSREQKDSIDIQIRELIGKHGIKSGVNLFPTELKRRWKILFKKDYEKVLEYCFKQMPKTLRVNTIKTTPEKLLKAINKYSWEVKPLDFSKSAFRLTTGVAPKFGDIREFQKGLFYVQEMASMLPVIVLDPRPGDKVLDMAAAPGSKTTQIAELMKNTGEILANDISSERLDVLKQNSKKLGIKNIKIRVGDGVELGGIFREKFDKVLVDAPCSNEGILRYKAHKFLEWNLLLIYRLVQIQKDLLESGFKSLKTGGILVYSTCSYNPEENEAVVDSLLKKHPNADIEPVKFNGVKTRKGLTKWEHFDFDKRLESTLRVLPQDNDSIGFYLAKIKKKRGKPAVF